MKKRKWTWAVGALFVIVALVMIAIRVSAGRDEAALQEQLRLARAEGIPTNWKEFAATIPTAKPSENAAPLYMHLIDQTLLGGDPKKADQDLIFHPNAKNLTAAQAILSKCARRLKLIDEAVLLPRCWFNVDWLHGGPAPLEPESMKLAAKLVLLRGSVAASKGDVATALDGVRRAFLIARHAGEEPGVVNSIIRGTVYDFGIKDLEYWAFMHRDRPEYREALQKAIDGSPRPNLKHECREDLCFVLSIVDLSLTPEGLNEDDVPVTARLCRSL